MRLRNRIWSICLMAAGLSFFVPNQHLESRSSIYRTAIHSEVHSADPIPIPPNQLPADKFPQQAADVPQQLDASQKADNVFPLQWLPNFGKPFSLLVVGIDSRAGEPARSDSLLFSVVNPARGEVRILQIPRDTYVPVKGHGYTKINHAMSYGQVPLLKQTVENWLQTDIDHTAVIDFDGFRQLIDLLGGVPVRIDKNMDYEDPTDGTSIHLKAGERVLNGKQALDFVRYRHDAEADTGRMRRQRQVLFALGEKSLSIHTVPKLPKIQSLLGKHLQTSMSIGEVAQLLRSGLSMDAKQTHVETIKGVNRVAPQDGIWYFFVEKDEQERIRKMVAQWLRGNLD
ncbi:LCP family protein [Effusibacillus dendaii]|uniref:Cell envelope-related transcriptional attenuator domain-containing protein n=1 Tax=Effusibacillus dendaii TaxID=2743772 RepID=A0A7I8DFW7_9BACL|nr:LCP family protein [Effusibacillus dendaii]BCJ87839.1 hypothetical protein skT53_28240 [Effusibacillus dendaii]